VSARERMTVAAALAVLLATSALVPIFDSQQWALRVAGAVLAVAVMGLVSRRSGVPAVLQPLLTLLALVGYVFEAFTSATLRYGLVPTGHSLSVLSALVAQGRLDIAQYGPPVPVGNGLVLLATAGVGAIAVAVDLVAVVLGRAAIAGLLLLLLFAVPSAVLPGGLGALPFSLGAAGWLGTLLVEGGERVGQWGAPLRTLAPGVTAHLEADSSLGRVGRRIGVAAVGMAVIVPALLPGLDHRLVGGSGEGDGSSGSGDGPRTATTYNPITTLRDQLRLPQPRQLLVYTTTDPEPDYLRMTTLDQYSGTGWSASSLQVDRTTGNVNRGVPASTGDTGGRHRDLRMTLGIDTLKVSWLPVPFGPRKISVRGAWVWDGDSETAFSATRSTQGLPSYEVTASRALPDRAELDASSGPVPDSISTRYATPVQASAAVVRTTDRITAGAAGPYEKAVALQSYFTSARNGFVYSLDATTGIGGPDQLEAFLTSKRGFCEQYATAMAAMLRIEGIPSRVAVGFTPGHRAGNQRAYSVTTSDAHAWPEAWFAGAGWVRFEPTPLTDRITTPAYSRPTAATPPGSTVVPAPSAAVPPALRKIASDRDPDLLLTPQAGNPAAARARRPGPLPPVRVLLLVLAAVLLVLPVLLHALRHRMRWRSPTALTAWEQVQLDAVDVGHRFRACDSPRTAAGRLAEPLELSAPAEAALTRIAGSAERARYALTGSGAGRDPAADAALVRAALLAGATGPVRWRARLLPPSTLSWAGTALGRTTADVLDRVDEAFAVLGRLVRRRPRAV